MLNAIRGSIQSEVIGTHLNTLMAKVRECASVNKDTLRNARL